MSRRCRRDHVRRRERLVRGRGGHQTSRVEDGGRRCVERGRGVERLVVSAAVGSRAARGLWGVWDGGGTDVVVGGGGSGGG